MLATDYRSFLASKRLAAPSAGIDVESAALHPAMRDFERAELGISKQDTEDRYAPTRPLVLPAWLRSEERVSP
jgi:hypothetical protein